MKYVMKVFFSTDNVNTGLRVMAKHEYCGGEELIKKNNELEKLPVQDKIEIFLSNK